MIFLNEDRIFPFHHIAVVLRFALVTEYNLKYLLKQPSGYHEKNHYKKAISAKINNKRRVLDGIRAKIKHNL